MIVRIHLLGIFLFLCYTPAIGQLQAGEVPEGMTAIDMNVTLSLTAPVSVDSVALEFDCDDAPDAWIFLHRGAPEVDAPHYAELRFVDEDVEVCAGLFPLTEQPKYHAYGESMDCSGDHDWQGGELFLLGDFGGFVPSGPATLDSLYIAYRRGAQTGWMLLSFDLQGNPTVNLTVHRILSICAGVTAMEEATDAPRIILHPNPANGVPLLVECDTPIRSIVVLDATGRTISSYDGSMRTIPSPVKVGTYLVRALHADGRISTLRLIRDR